MIAVIRGKRDFNYANETIPRMLSCLDSDVHVFCEPDAADFTDSDKCNVHQNNTTLGVAGNWKQAAEFLLQQDNPWITICEDDALVLPAAKTNLCDFVENTDPKSTGFISSYCSTHCAILGITGWTKHRGDDWCGMLMMTLSPLFASWFIQSRFMSAALSTNSLDGNLGKAAYASGLNNYKRQPSDVDHIGTNSTFPSWRIQHEHPRRTPYFSGRRNCVGP